MWYADSQGLPAVAPLYDISTIFYFADKPDPQPVNAAVGLVVHLTLAAAFGAVLAALAPLAKGAGRLMGFGAAAVGAAGRDARGDRLLRAPSASSAQRDLVLTAINQGAVLLDGAATTTTYARCALNFMVPLVVTNVGLLGGRPRPPRMTPSHDELRM